MNRSEVQFLQSVRSFPSLSILLPTYRGFPERRQNPIRVKNLVTQAAARLHQECEPREASRVTSLLQSLTEAIDYRSTQEGLALFVNQEAGHKFILPVPVRERIVIDHTFATRDLVSAINRASEYFVLSLSEHTIRLFQGVQDTAGEMRTGGFPLVYEGPGRTERIRLGPGVEKTALMDDYMRHFFRHADAALSQVRKQGTLPVVLVGVEHNLALFREVSRNLDAVIATLVGTHEMTPAHELAALVWPHVRRAMSERRNQILQQVEAAIGLGNAARGMNETWQAAQDGRGQTLVVEEDYRFPARLENGGRELVPAGGNGDSASAPDAVDELVALVLDKGGRVVFVDPGTLAKHDRVAMILRY